MGNGENKTDFRVGAVLHTDKGLASQRQSHYERAQPTEKSADRKARHDAERSAQQRELAEIMSYGASEARAMKIALNHIRQSARSDVFLKVVKQQAADLIALFQNPGRIELSVSDRHIFSSLATTLSLAVLADLLIVDNYSGRNNSPAIKFVLSELTPSSVKQPPNPYHNEPDCTMFEVSRYLACAAILEKASLVMLIQDLNNSSDTEPIKFSDTPLNRTLVKETLIRRLKYVVAHV